MRRLAFGASIPPLTILVLLTLRAACLPLISNAVSFGNSRTGRDESAGFVGSLRSSRLSSSLLSLFWRRQEQPEPLRVWIDAFGLAKGEATIMLETVEVSILVEKERKRSERGRSSTKIKKT